MESATSKKQVIYSNNRVFLLCNTSIIWYINILRPITILRESMFTKSGGSTSNVTLTLAPSSTHRTIHTMYDLMTNDYFRLFQRGRIKFRITCSTQK